MAVRFDASADYLSRTTNLLNYNSAYTVCFWVYLSTDTNYYTHYWAICASATEAVNDYQNSDFVGGNIDGTSVRVGAYVGGSGSDGIGTSLTTATWYHIAVRRSSASLLEAFLNGTLDATCTQDTTGRTAVAGEYMGRFNGTGFEMNGRVAHYRSWDRALSDAEIRSESLSSFPVTLDSIRHVNPMYPGERTYEQLKGQSFTENGTLTDEDGPKPAIASIRYRVPARVVAGAVSQMSFRPAIQTWFGRGR